MPKEVFKHNTGVKIINSITVGLESQQSIIKKSHLICSNEHLYDAGPGRIPSLNGVLDRKMGCNTKDSLCETCGQNHTECAGHYGYIDLNSPTFHCGYFNHVIRVLKMICKTCSNILLTPHLQEEFTMKLSKDNLLFTKKKILIKNIIEVCQKVKICHNCGSYNGMVKKVTSSYKLGLISKPVLKIAHVTATHKGLFSDENFGKYSDAIKKSSDIEQIMKLGYGDILYPNEVLRLFSDIPNPSIILLVIDNVVNHPKHLILKQLAVPPLNIRPTVSSDERGGTNEDDLTIKLNDIILMNQQLKKLKTNTYKLNGFSSMYECWDSLQVAAALYINSDISGIPFSMKPKRTGRGVIQRVKGKKGRIRGNLCGKRVNFSGRTVISPDPYLEIDQVGIPEQIAKILTFPNIVQAFNIDYLKRCVRNGANIWPGANYVISANGERRNLKYGNREEIANNLKIGDVVETHLANNDVLLFNRQPSLHILSIMSFRVRVHPFKTFQFNECCCAPYNADFDGDEMNIHVPQTLEAKAEAFILMTNKNNLVTPKNGEIIIGGIQDFLTGAYLLTSMDRFFDYHKASMIVYNICTVLRNVGEFPKLPKPAIIKPKPMWTGKQLLSLIFRLNQSERVKINLVSQGKGYIKNREFCLSESYVIIRNSELLAGRLNKSHLGSSGKTSNVLYLIMKDFSSNESIKVMSRLAKITSNYLMTFAGFSIGLEDVMPSQELVKQKAYLLETANEKCEALFIEMKENRLQCVPGCTAEQSLENKVLNELSQVRDKCGEICGLYLPKYNSPWTMAASGSKGSPLNVSQMILSVGQQALAGKRVPDDYDGRSSLYFARFSKAPTSKGFVESSFQSGLVCSEVFFHSMAGREGLVDAAVKTADTGYMQRRLVKALEDIVISYDNTVRNSEKEVIDFLFGGDGLNSSLIEGKSTALDFERVFDHISAILPLTEKDQILEPQEIAKITTELLESKNYAPDTPRYYFKQDLQNFINTHIKKYERSLKVFQSRAYTMYKISKDQLVLFIETCFKKYNACVIEPNTAIGALSATSIGEPSTQMTLKTFHFTGIASMNITQGVPRLKEIINVNKRINTPLIMAKLLVDDSLEYAQMVKNKLQKVTLGEILVRYNIVYDDPHSYILLTLKPKRNLMFSADRVKRKLITNSKLKLEGHNISVISNNSLAVLQKNDDNISHVYKMNKLVNQLKTVVISGYSSVVRVVICPNVENEKTTYSLCIESDCLLDVISTFGIDPHQTTTNHLYTVKPILGISNAENLIVSEIENVMGNYGINVDFRHIMLLAAQMTQTGDVLGITRYGMAKMRQSVLNLASFEQTSDHLFDAAYHGQADQIQGVSENVMVGMPAPIGTGLFQILEKRPYELKKSSRKLTTFQRVFNK